MDLKALVRTIPDFPSDGIEFRDITTLLLDPAGFRTAIDRMAEQVGDDVDYVAGLDARGFLFSAGIAYARGLGHVLLRKADKLPGTTIGVDYELEYGSDRIEMHADAVQDGDRVVLVDDLVATGGTAAAGVEVLRRAGATVERAVFLVDLVDLGGADRLRDHGVEPLALMTFEGG